MISRLPILSTLGGMFNRRDPRQEAGLALTRLLSQFDMEAMPYDRGMRESRRDDNSRHVAIGVWLIPLTENQDPDKADLNKAIPAATCDLRRHGIGVLMPVKLQSKKFIVAIADMEKTWRFFLVGVRHQSDRPGGWFQLGLSVDRIWEPDSLQTVQFRHRIENAFRD